jgi:hypothetical protein
MTLTNDCGIGRSECTGARRISREHQLGRKLAEYEGFVRWQARRLSRTYEDRKDFAQVGREAVVRVFEATRKGLKVRSEKGYYLNAIKNAMIDYFRKEYRPNHAVWEYDRKNGPIRVKRYRYHGRWKGRIQYHGDKLKRVALKHQAPLNFDEVFSARRLSVGVFVRRLLVEDQ